MRVLGTVLRRIGGTRAFALAAGRVAAPVDRFLHRVSGGRLHVSDSFTPTLVLVTTGRRSGRRRATPLLFVRDGEDYVVAASNFGRPSHPDWSANLLADPEAWVELAGGRQPVRARLAEPDEKARLWPRLVALWPGYADYEARASREIRVFVLSPRAGSVSAPGGPAPPR